MNSTVGGCYAIVVSADFPIACVVRYAVSIGNRFAVLICDGYVAEFINSFVAIRVSSGFVHYKGDGVSHRIYNGDVDSAVFYSVLRINCNDVGCFGYVVAKRVKWFDALFFVGGSD